MKAYAVNATGLGDSDHDGHSGLAPSRPAGGRTRRLNEARILEAAEAVFAEAGFNGASVQAIAERAGLPKANIHYYFGTKELLYRTLLDTILDMWVDAFDHFAPDADPAVAMERYILDKMSWSRNRPLASKVFANEIIHGAQQVEPYLSTKLRETMKLRTGVVEGWIAEGKMAPIAPDHLFFTLWAMTQTYADFDVQIKHVLNTDHISDAEFKRATDNLVDFVLRGCGLKRAAPHDDT